MDISVPGSLTTITTLPLPFDATGIEISGSYLYLSLGPVGVQIYDLSNAAAPSLVAEVATGGQASDLFVDGDLALVAAGFWGLYILSVADPLDPVIVGHLSFPTEVRAVSAGGTTGYALLQGWSLAAFDFSDPADPTPLAEYKWSLPLGDVQYVDDVIHLSVSNRYLTIAPYCPLDPVAVESPLTSMQAWNVSPNPFREELRIALGAPLDASSEVRIVDARGATVRVLDRSTGTDVLTWDGRNADGRLVPAGVYFLRSNAGSSLGARVVRVR